MGVVTQGGGRFISYAIFLTKITTKMNLLITTGILIVVCGLIYLIVPDVVEGYKADKKLTWSDISTIYIRSVLISIGVCLLYTRVKYMPPHFIIISIILLITVMLAVARGIKKRENQNLKF